MIQLNGAGESLINNISHFEVIYQMQKSLARTLLNVAVRNHSNIDVTVISRIKMSIIMQLYRTVLRDYKTNLTTAYRSMLSIHNESNKMSKKDVVLVLLDFTLNEINIFENRCQCFSKSSFPNFQKYQGW